MQSLNTALDHSRQHSFAIEATQEEGIANALEWIEARLYLSAANNPDVIILRHGLFSVEDARYVSEIAAQAPISNDKKAVIIFANRAYHEAQNAMLKLFEEPPSGTYLFLIMPSLGGLLPTLRSRVHVLPSTVSKPGSLHSEIAAQFLKANTEKRSALIKKLTSGRDEEEKRVNREEAIAIMNGIEAAAYARLRTQSEPGLTALLSDIATVRGYLYDRSAPVRMILEHLSLVIPKNLF